MPSFNDLISKSGKGLSSNKDLIFLLDINLGGTLGTYTCANLGRDVEGNFYKSKLQNTGSIHRSVQPDNGQFETSDLSITLANGDLEFSKAPWNYTVLNKPAILRMGFAGNSTIEYLADCSYLADGSITANCGPLGAGSPGDISVGIAYTLYKGIIKKEDRGGKEFKLSIGDYTNKIFVDIPPRTIDVNEFPFVGTSVMVLGTKTDADTSLVGKGIPYLYGDFSGVSLIKPFFVDTAKRRYLIADHAIGTVSKVMSGGTQVYNFTHPNINGFVAGTHLTGTNIMSFIDFGTSQGTKNVYLSVTGRYDTYGTLLENPALILKDILLSSNICDLVSTDIGTTSFDTSESWLNTYKFRYIMNGDMHKNSIDLIQDLSVCSLSTFHFDKDNLAQLNTYRPAVSRSYIKKIQQTDILEDSFNVTRDIRDVYNKAIVNYDYDWVEKKYRNEYKIEGTVYVSKFDTVKTFKLNAPFIYTSTEAMYACRKWLSKLQNGLNKVTFDLPLSKLPIDVDDRIQLTHDEAPTSTGGWVDRLINIYECEIDNRGKKISISGIDEDEVNIGNKYFILGQGTAYYRSASEAQRYYGALCSLGGTMSNSDIGYILW